MQIKIVCILLAVFILFIFLLTKNQPKTWFQIDSWATEDPYEVSRSCKNRVTQFLDTL